MYSMERPLATHNRRSDLPWGVVVASGDGKHAVTRSVAETVSVRADPAPPPRPPLPEQLVISSDRYGR